MEPVASLPFLQEHASCPYPEPDESNTYRHILIHFNIINPSYNLFPSRFPTMIFYVLLVFLMRITYLSHLITLGLIML
jgi:hypothetical protein